MRRILAGVLATLALMLGALAVGVQPAAADDLFLPPNTYRDLHYGSCHVRVLFGNYSNAYAVMGEYGDSVCHPATAVRVVYATPIGTLGSSIWCNNGGRLVNLFPYDCAYDGWTTMAMAPPYTAVGVHAQLCLSQSNCATIKLSIWGSG